MPVPLEEYHGALAAETATELEAGYDHVYFHWIGDNQEKPIELSEEDVLPSFR